jgi:hypothetical protein
MLETAMAGTREPLDPGGARCEVIPPISSGTWLEELVVAMGQLLSCSSPSPSPSPSTGGLGGGEAVSVGLRR